MAVTRWGQARKEVILNKPLIEQRIAEGCSVRAIWLELTDVGSITVALCNFNNQVKTQLGPKADLNKRLPSPQPPTPKNSTSLKKSSVPAPQAAGFGMSSGLKGFSPIAQRVDLSPPEDADLREQNDAD